MQQISNYQRSWAVNHGGDQPTGRAKEPLLLSFGLLPSLPSDLTHPRDSNLRFPVVRIGRSNSPLPPESTPSVKDIDW
ncbi:hypothetical protein PG995_004720 [Apiospora arundinis]